MLFGAGGSGRGPSPVAPVRFAWSAWGIVALGFVLAYGFMFTYVHVTVDTRPCVAHLPDPLFALIPYDPWWFKVSHEVYYVFTFSGLGVLFFQAYRGDHLPLLRWISGMSVQALLRSATLLLLPLCRTFYAAGAPATTMEKVSHFDLGFVRIPWRVWAINDLVFSGHVGEFLLMFWVSRAWPTRARLLLIAFQILQLYALIATRGHYTVDLLIALPCAYLADGVGCWILARLRRRNEAAR